MGTHIDWRHDGVTARMIDWFWSNMEKGFILWHPEQHEALEWAVPPKHGDPLRRDPHRPADLERRPPQNLYIRFERLEDVAPEIRDYIVYEHVVIMAGLGLGEECLRTPIQWDTGSTNGRRPTTASTENLRHRHRKKETVEDGKVWAAHNIQEIGNWGVFLPQIYSLYKVVTDTTAIPSPICQWKAAGATPATATSARGKRAGWAGARRVSF